MASGFFSYDNRMTKALPVDDNKRVYPRLIPNAIFSVAHPQPVLNPVLVALSADALKLIGLENLDHLTPKEMEELVLILSGNKVDSGSSPHAHCYCGYQFGIFTGQLGDGAAISLGEVISPKNPNDEMFSSDEFISNRMNSLQRWELQIKGAGITTFSRK